MNNYWAILQRKKPISSNFAPKTLRFMNKEEMVAELHELQNQITRHKNGLSVNKPIDEIVRRYEELKAELNRFELKNSPSYKARTFSEKFLAEVEKKMAKNPDMSLEKASDEVREEMVKNEKKSNRGGSYSQVYDMSDIFSKDPNFTIYKEPEPGSDPEPGNLDGMGLYRWTSDYRGYEEPRRVTRDGVFQIWDPTKGTEGDWVDAPEGSSAMEDYLQTRGVSWDENTGYMKSVDGNYYRNNSNNGKFIIKDKDKNDHELKFFDYKRAYPEQKTPGGGGSVPPGAVREEYKPIAQNTWENDGSLASIAERRAAWQMA